MAQQQQIKAILDLHTKGTTTAALAGARKTLAILIPRLRYYGNKKKIKIVKKKKLNIFFFIHHIKNYGTTTEADTTTHKSNHYGSAVTRLHNSNR